MKYWEFLSISEYLIHLGNVKGDTRAHDIQ